MKIVLVGVLVVPNSLALANSMRTEELLMIMIVRSVFEESYFELGRVYVSGGHSVMIYILIIEIS